MSKKVLVISSSLRQHSNSGLLAREAAKGAEAAGHDVEFLTLADKDIRFCTGCLVCQNTQKCVIHDDAAAIADKIGAADVLIFATPIYYYELCGQLKTLLDRCNPLYTADYRFRDVYLITASAEDTDDVADTAANGLKGWISCFPKASFKGLVSGGGLSNPSDAEHHSAIRQQAYHLGKNI